VTALTALTPAQIAPLLAASVATMRSEIRALGEAARWQPAAGEWSVSECLGHLIEADRRGFAGRIREILAGDQVVLTRWDPPAVAAARHDNEADPIELVEGFAAQRSEAIALVRSLSATDLSRVGIHPEIGPLRVDEILAEWPHHDRSHVRQALAVTQARVWAQMGATQRFSEPAG
jgi:hypothetical protein